MRHSVLSRWQGSLLGTSLGECLTQQGSRWQEIHQQGVRHLASTGQGPSLQGDLDASEIPLQHLPRLLFFHDQPQGLREQLLAIAKQQNYSQATTSAIIAYAIAMSWSLREQLDGTTLFRDLLATSEGESSSRILQTLQTNLEKGKLLRETSNQLSSTCQAIWLALYCFATTSEELMLSLSRGQTLTSVSPVLLPLVGALSGAHNGMSAIPIPWRCWLTQQRQQWEPELEAMFATWSGSYELAKINPSLKQSAIAASQVIQARRNYQILF